MNLRATLFLVAAGAAALSIGGQASKKPLDHGVYDGWRAVRAPSFSRNGDWLSFTIAPQVGDALIVVRSSSGGQEHRIERGSAGRFSRDGKFFLATIVPPKAEVDRAKKEKKAPKDMPKNALSILDLRTGKTTTIERLKSWRLPDKDSGWFSYAVEDPPAPPKPEAKPDPKPESKPEAKAEPKPEQKPEEKPQKKKDHAQGSEQILRNLETGEERKVADVSSFDFSEDGSVLVYAVSSKGGEADGVYQTDVASGKSSPLLTGLGRYTQLAIHNKTKRVAFSTDRDDYKSETPSPSVYVFESGSKEAKLIAKDGTPGLAKGWAPVSRGSVAFSDSGNRVMFEVAPKPEPEPKDETPEDEKVVLDVWNWKDPLLQPNQLLQAAAERNRSYTAAAFLDSKKVVQLEDEALPMVTVSAKGDGAFALGWTNAPYRQLISWDQSYNDVYLVDVASGARRQIQSKLPGVPQFSPGGKYLAWYDERSTSWYAASAAFSNVVNLSEKIPHPIHNEEHDTPDLPPPYGSGGWLDNDAGILLYDRYDIWLCDPSGGALPRCVTEGNGRAWSTAFRRVDTDPEVDTIAPSKFMLLYAENLNTQATGFYRDAPAARALPEKLVSGDKIFTYAAKAEDSERILITRQDFTEYPNLWLTDLGFSKLERVSDANPQQKDFVWGKAELVQWSSLDGTPLQGVLVKPEDFDPAKKYPMIVYFYERSADLLHRHRVPAPSASTINPTMYASNGYLVFMPDISYSTGYPGASAEKAILPGVTAMIARGYVDAKRIACQGQSWGGYQVGHLVTRTHLFAAACAGAPVSNMFSAYGGIRYGSGLVRQMQYEKGQSRIGGSIWDRPLQFLENSPIFWADNVQTPLLIMSNDRDGAVPWTQGIEYFTALRRLGKPTWLCNYNGDDHNLTKRPNQKDWAIRMQQFFDHYLKGSPAPVWMVEGVPAVKKGKTLGLDVPGGKG